MSTQPKNRRQTPVSGAKRKNHVAPLPKSNISERRKTEVLGIILMVLGFLLSLSILTYHPADDPHVTGSSILKLLSASENPAHNSLGLLGARIAFLLVPSFLGYYSISLTLLLIVAGYMIFRHRSVVVLSWIAALAFWSSLVLACLAGWWNQTPSNSEDIGATEWSGAVGGGIADWMFSVFGKTGSLILLLLFVVILLLIAVDRDIQKTFDRLEAWSIRLKNRLQEWRTERQERRKEALEAMNMVEDDEADAISSKPARPQSVSKATPIKKEAETPIYIQPDKQRAHLQRANRRIEDGQDDETPPFEVESRRTISYNPAQEISESAKPIAIQPAETPRKVELSPIPKKNPPLADDLEQDFKAVYGKPSAVQPRSIPQIPLQVQTKPTSTEVPFTIQLPPEETTLPNDSAPTVFSRAIIEKTFNINYSLPPLELLDFGDDDEVDVDYDELEENKEILLEKLLNYNIQIDAISAIPGPTVTLYELTPAPGIKISKIKSLEDDLAMVLAARGIRIIAPIPGKAVVGIEIPNRNRELVRIHQLLSSNEFRNTDKDLPVVMGKTISGEAYIEDLTKMPHLLVAGATGSGKSVGVNTLIAGLLYHCHPDDLKFVMIDPKKIELQQYSAILQHFIAMPENGDNPIITDFTQALSTLKSCEKEMELRYDLLADAGVRGIKDYNRKFKSGKLDISDGHKYLPYIVVIVDELADLMMTAGKDIEAPIARLAQMARAVGIHLVLATQRPSVDVITGLIKANFPSRIAFQVASKIDSRTILDQNGAEQLVGNGDFLYMNGSRIVRVQSPYISVDEVEELTKFIGSQKGNGSYVLPSVEIEGSNEPYEETDRAAANLEKKDPLFDECARIIVRSQQGSVSLLQRKLSIGYTRAARIVDQLEHAGIVGPFEGSKARAVLVQDEFQLDQLLATDRDA